MVRRRAGDDAGLSLAELVVVIALLGVSLTTVYTVLFTIFQSASSNMDQASASHDLAYTMELLSRTVSGSKVLYADDQRILMLVQTGASTYQMNEVYVTTGSAAAGDRGNLVWERWDTDAIGSAPIGSYHNVWIVSDRNANLYTSPPTSLFVYFRDSTEGSVMVASDKASLPDTSMSAFVGALPGGYTTASIGRIKMHLVSAIAGSSKDDTRDITLRLRN
jgi:Tfp pilus assembly protein PilV